MCGVRTKTSGATHKMWNLLQGNKTNSKPVRNQRVGAREKPNELDMETALSLTLKFFSR